jgi:hypothetical protein
MIAQLKAQNLQLRDKQAKLSQALDIALAKPGAAYIANNGNNSEGNNGSSQRETLQNAVKLKDREIAHYVQIINAQKKQLDQLKGRLEQKEGF